MIRGDILAGPGFDPAAGSILLSNDDGVSAPGMRVLTRIAKNLSDDVWICAPEQEQSGAGHSLTMRRPLRLRALTKRRWAVDGTPTDAVLLGVRQLMRDHPPKLVLSGVNRGANLGEDVTYSGTVAAAMEATLLGLPAIALSLEYGQGDATHWSTVETHAPELIRDLLAIGWPRHTVLNINFPHCLPDQVQGVEITRQGRRKLGEQLGERVDMRGEPYYWIGPMREEDPAEPGTDLHAIMHRRISVTPLHLDLTCRPTLSRLAPIAR